MTQVRRQRADWSDLRVFWAVAETGGLGAASRALGLSQPTVTRRLDDLEIRLGTQLLVRGPTGVTLTEAGRMMLDHVLTMERSADAIERMVLDRDRREEGTVRISAPDGAGALAIAPALPAFLQSNPKVSITLDCGLWPDSPVSEHVDLAVQFSDSGSHPDFVSTPLGWFHYALVASPRYLELYGTPRTLQEVASHRLVHHSAMTRQPEGWSAKTASFHDLAHVGLMTNSSPAFHNAVRAGAGIGAMPTAILAQDPELVMLDIPPMARLQLWLCHHRDIPRSARMKLVIEWLQEIFEPRTHPWYRAEFVHPSEFAAVARETA